MEQNQTSPGEKGRLRGAGDCGGDGAQGAAAAIARQAIQIRSVLPQQIAGEPHYIDDDEQSI